MLYETSMFCNNVGNLILTYEDAYKRARHRLDCDLDNVPQYYLAVLGASLLQDMDEDQALATIEKFLESPVGQDYIEHIRDTEDPV
jgi:hypothetical protein